MRHLLMMTAALVGLAGPLAAADVALIVGNGSYDQLRDLRGGEDVVQASDALNAQGFDVIALEDAGQGQVAAALDQFLRQSDGAGRVLVVLTGRFVNSTRDVWLLPVDTADVPGLAQIGAEGLPLSVLMTVLAAHPGKALLIVGDDGETGATGMPYLSRGFRVPEMPQGVTLFRGSASAVAGFVRDVLPLPAMAQTVQAARRQGLVGAGYMPEDFRFMVTAPAQVRPVVLQPAKPVQPAKPLALEVAAWDAAITLDSVESYTRYLTQYPDGPHAAEAKAMIREIRTNPNRDAQLDEAALRLSRDQRMQIQRNLSILDINPRGIDGLFGPGSRTAIATWQTSNGFAATGYVTADQIARLGAQADRRAVELEAQAEARKLEQERQDQTYWQATGAAGDEFGLRAYLKKYPDGIYAEVAQSRLAVFEDQARSAAAVQDRQAWDRVVAVNTADSYRQYLTAYPKGAFAAEAQARLDGMTQQTQQGQALAAAKEGEAQLGLSPQIRTMIERRLDALDLKPGPVDGVFDDKTRRSIRRYQTARDLPVTGYLNQQTVVRLMADSILR